MMGGEGGGGKTVGRGLSFCGCAGGAYPTNWSTPSLCDDHNHRHADDTRASARRQTRVIGGKKPRERTEGERSLDLYCPISVKGIFPLGNKENHAFKSKRNHV